MSIDTFDSFLADVYVSGLKAPIGSRRVGRPRLWRPRSVGLADSGLFLWRPRSRRKGDVVVPGRILIGLDAPKHGAVVAELGIRWAQRSGATLVGLGIVDEPGIRAIEPAWPVGGTPGVDPVYYMGYEARLADVHRQVEQLLEQFAARCAEAGVAHAEVKAVGSPHELIAAEAQSCDLILLARGSHFRFTARDDEADEILEESLERHPAADRRGPRDALPGWPDRDRV